MPKEKKIEIFIGKGTGGYSLHYRKENEFQYPEIVIIRGRFYDIMEGLLGISKDIYKKNIKKLSLTEYDWNKIPKKEKEIFKGVVNILEKFSIGEKNLEYKIKEIKKTLIHKNEESFGSLYAIVK